MTNEVGLSGEVVALFPVGSLDGGELRTFFQRPRKPVVLDPWFHFSKVGLCTHSHYKEEDGTWSMVYCSEPAINERWSSNGFLCAGHQGDSHGYRKGGSVRVDWDTQTIRDILHSDTSAIVNGKVTVVAGWKGSKLKILS